MSRVFIHRYSGILSAYGLALADVVHEAQEPCAKEYGGLLSCSQLVLYVHVDAYCHLLPGQMQHLTILMQDLML